MYYRSLTPLLKRFAEIYPIVGITGPRQSGKTTLAKTLFPHLRYVSLENLDTRAYALQDPRGFLATYAEGAIFDEVQNTPDLLSYLQGIVDENPTNGRYILTGSQNFSLSQHIAQSLPGRMGMSTLLPLSLEELGMPIDKLSAIFKGGYPGLRRSHILPIEFYPSYIQTYLERDVRQLKNISNLDRFQVFLKLCAGRVGQVINFSSLAQDAGVSHTTARAWLTVLQASYIIFFLPPFYRNFNKRIIKMPKLYFYDTGLACNLLGLEKESQLESHYLKGALFENLVILEVLKGRLNQGVPPNLYFWRDQTGREVDLIAEWGGKLKAMEVKWTQTFQPNHLKTLEYFQEIAPSAEGFLIYTGLQEGAYKKTTLVPLEKMAMIWES